MHRYMASRWLQAVVSNGSTFQRLYLLYAVYGGGGVPPCEMDLTPTVLSVADISPPPPPSPPCTLFFFLFFVHFCTDHVFYEMVVVFSSVTLPPELTLEPLSLCRTITVAYLLSSRRSRCGFLLCLCVLFCID